MASDLKKIAALWHKTSAKGTNFYSGKLDAEAVKSALAGGDTSLLLFKVKNKRDRGPDLELFVAPQRDTRQQAEPRPSRVDRADDDFGELP